MTRTVAKERRCNKRIEDAGGDEMKKGVRDKWIPNIQRPRTGRTPQMRNTADTVTRVGTVGTGFIARGAMAVLEADPSLSVQRVLTRRPLASVEGVPVERLTHSLDDLIEHSDVIFAASGDLVHATVVVERALAAGVPVVTMNSEFHVTTGSYFQGRGYLTEAEGDQPGAMALLHREAEGMAFRPMAYVNIKGFLNPDPTPEEMHYWSQRQGLSLPETISFTDGTKVQVEQAFCANGLGAKIICDGLLGRRVDDIYDTDELVEAAKELGSPVSDFVIAPGAPPGVFVLATHDVSQTLPHYGPYEKLFTKQRSAYLLLRPYHLCALEAAKSVRKARDGAPPLLTNGEVPYASVSAIVKCDLPAGTVIDHPFGNFELRGEAIVAARHLDHVPLGLLKGARIRHTVERGQRLTFADVELAPSRAVEIWMILRHRIIEQLRVSSSEESRPPNTGVYGSTFPA